MTYSLAGQTITAPDAGGHGLDMSNGQDWLVEDCLIDLSACPLARLANYGAGLAGPSGTGMERRRPARPVAAGQLAARYLPGAGGHSGRTGLGRELPCYTLVDTS